LVVASVQTLARQSRLDRLPRHFDTVVVDEATTPPRAHTDESSITLTPRR
jgi:hypothetical protein